MSTDPIDPLDEISTPPDPAIVDALTEEQLSELRPVADLNAGILFKPHENNQLTYDKRGKYILEYFPEGYIALQRELATGLHPKLEKLLAKHPADEIDIRLAEVATYCQVALEGTYTIEERSNLCAILAGRLELLREVGAIEKGKIILS